MGRWINHGGWYPDYKLRLFRKSKGRWGGKDPHDRVMLDGSSAYLKSDLLHYVYRNLSHQLQTVDNFSAITATILDEEGTQFSAAQLVFRPVLKFLGTYFNKRGFMDRLPGFIISPRGAVELSRRLRRGENPHTGAIGSNHSGTIRGIATSAQWRQHEETLSGAGPVVNCVDLPCFWLAAESASRHTTPAGQASVKAIPSALF